VLINHEVVFTKAAFEEFIARVSKPGAGKPDLGKPNLGKKEAAK
jgi:hypothetical protein